jgi:hypothetical protein
MWSHGLGGGRSSPSFDGILFPLRTPRADVVREEADIPEKIVL